MDLRIMRSFGADLYSITILIPSQTRKIGKIRSFLQNFVFEPFFDKRFGSFHASNQLTEPCRIIGIALWKPKSI